MSVEMHAGVPADRAPGTDVVIDLRRLQRSADFAAALAATDLRWPDLAGEIVHQIAHLVGDGVALFQPGGPGEPLAVQAADHRDRSAARRTWVDLARLAEVLTARLAPADGPAAPFVLALGAPAEAASDPATPSGEDRGGHGERAQRAVRAVGPAERPCVLVAPLAVGHEPLGALVVARDPASPPFDDDDLDTLADLAGRAAIALHDSRLLHGARADAQAAVESDALSRAILQSALDAVIVVDHDGRIDSVNPAAEALTGYSAPDLVGRHLDVLLPHRRSPQASARSDPPPASLVGRRQEVALRRRDGTEEPVELSVSEVEVGGRRLFVGIARDLGQRKEEVEQLRTAAQADVLTGLVNRASFHRALNQRIDAGHTFAVLFLDLDGFKAVNDSLGHQAGDEVLQEVAARLREAVRRHDLVARYGGDEFVVVVDSVDDAGPDADRVADRIRAAFHRPFDLDGTEVVLDVSIGRAIHPDDGRTISALITHADRAMYAEKRAKRPDRSAS